MGESKEAPILKHVTINFEDGDTIGIDCLDIVLNQGFLTVFIPEDEFGNKTVQAYNTDTILDWEFIQNGGE